MLLRKDLNIDSQWVFFGRLSTLSGTVTSRWSSGINGPKGVSNKGKTSKENKGCF